MKKKIGKIVLLLAVIALFCAVPATALINTIGQGNVVFIGEEGLDITGAMGLTDTSIGWWASAADIDKSAPSKSIELSTRMNSFMVSQSDFAGYLGNWYRLNAAGKSDGVAFSVADPQLSLKYEDTTVSVDVDRLHWIPTGDNIRFLINTNLVQMATQRGSPPLISIKVQSPDGAMYSSVYDAWGNPTPLADIQVTTSPFYTDSVWNMGNQDRYPQGMYTVWAECNVNHMKDNYGETGKTISSQVSLLNQGGNPLIKTATPTTRAITIPTTVITTVITTLTPVTTTVATQSPAVVTTEATLPVPATTSAPIPAKTKAPGFEGIIACAALVIGCAVCLKKE